MKSAEEKVLDGSVWEDFCDQLKAAGKLIDSAKAPQDVFNRAEGYRYLARMVRYGLEGIVEYADRDFPVLHRGCHETIKLGMDNPDNIYQGSPLNPNNEYRISGTRGTVDYLGISTTCNRYAEGKSMEVTGFRDSRDMVVGEDGSLEIIVSQTEQPGNWIPMTADTNSLLVRQTFQDRKGEQAAELTIERLNGGDSRPEPLTAERLVRGLERVTQFLHNTPQMFENWAEGFLEHSNQLPHADQAYCQLIGGDPNIHYFHSHWQLADDEALIIEAPSIPECQTWNFQLNNWWLESLDYVNHTIHYNKHTASYENDGSVKIVVAHQKPNHPNWVETAGHRDGTMSWRWIGATEHPDVHTRVVKFSELDGNL